MNDRGYGSGIDDPEEGEGAMRSVEDDHDAPEDRGLRAELQALPLEAQPARDLWPGIEARMSARSPGVADGYVGGVGGVGAAGPGARPRRGPSLSWGQLAAAAVALMVVSGSLVWLGTGIDGPGPVASASGDGAPRGAMEVQMAAAEDAFGTYDLAVSDLRRIVEEASERLEPETVRVLQDNLATVEQALAEAREALLADPSGDEMGRLLSGTMRRRLNVLRNAVTTAVAQS